MYWHTCLEILRWGVPVGWRQCSSWFTLFGLVSRWLPHSHSPHPYHSKKRGHFHSNLSSRETEIASDWNTVMCLSLNQWLSQGEWNESTDLLRPSPEPEVGGGAASLRGTGTVSGRGKHLLWRTNKQMGMGADQTYWKGFSGDVKAIHGGKMTVRDSWWALFSALVLRTC